MLHAVSCGFCRKRLWLPEYLLDRTRYCNPRCLGAASRKAEKTCTICRVTKPRHEFAGKDGDNSYCKPCHNEWRRNRRATNEQYRVNNHRANRKLALEVRSEVQAVKAASPCADCGQKFKPWQMQFDHVRGKKVGNVSALASSGRRALVLAEIKKCDIVCANCHADRTYRRMHADMV